MDAMSQADVMKTPEEILTLYQQMLAAIVQSSEDAIVSKNLDGIITSWNPGAEKLFGYPMEEMIGRHITTIIPPERLDEEPRMIEMVKRGERVLPFDTIRMRKDGQRVHISLTLSPIRDIDGKIVGVSKIARDITLQKKLNDDLLQSENRLRLATEAGAMGIWDWDVVNEEMVWDGRSKEFFGLGPQATLNYATYLSAIHPDDRSRVEEELRKLFDSSNEGEYDTEYRTIGIEDRKIRWIKAKGTTFYNNGQPYRITGTLQDITSQKQSEQQLKESEERLRMAIQATKLGTWDYRPKTNELYWSDECRKIYDLPPHVTISYALFEEHIHPDDKELASSAISKAMDPGGDGTYDIQYRILRYSDKKPRWIKAQGKVYFDPTGVPELFIGTVLDFSAEKVKEQELKDSISLFQRMADTVPVIIWTTRADGYCNYLNEFWYNYTGQTPDKALGFGWLDAVHPDDRAESGKIFLDANELKKSFSLIYRVRGKNGEFRWMMNAARPRFDFDGKYEGLTGVVVDIHERKQAEEALRESEYRLNMALETAEMGTWLVHFKNGENIYSKGYLRIMGFDENSLPTYKELVNQVYPEDMPIRETAIENAKKSGILDTEIRIIRKDRSVRWIRANGKVFYARDGSPDKMMGTILDITDQKEAFNKLQASESRLTKLADAMPQLVWIAEPGGTITYYNNRISEYGSNSLEATDIWEWQPLVHPDDVDATLADWYNAISTRQPYSHEHRMLMKDGTYRWHLSRGFPDKDSAGNILKWFGTATDIHDIKMIQQSMEESEERLRFTLEAATMGTWSIDLATGKAITSERHREILEYEEKENLTREIYLKHMLPEDRARLDVLFHRGLVEGRYQFEGRILPPGKPLKWVKVQAKTIYDNAGKPKTVLGTIVDITDEKSAASAIQESEERFRIIANTAPVMIWMSGNDRFADFFNTSWLNYTGRTLEQERNEGWQESVYPEDLPRCIRVYKEAYAAQRPFTIEYRLRRNDGEYRWILDNAVPRYSHDGKFIGFVSACMDIDDERKFNEKLQASELMFKTITNVSPVGLWMTDEHGQNNYVNDTWINWTGIAFDPESALGWMEPVMEADKDTVYRQFLENLSERKKYTAEFRFKRRDGQVRWGLTEGFPYYDDAGNFGGYAGSVTDITERKQSEILKNDFLAVASHELKTPLTSIKAYAQLLSQTYEKANDAFLKNGLLKMENQVNKMTKLVADFLNLSKLESEKFRLDIELFDINELVREIAIDIQMVAINHTILLERRHPVFVYADREKISQVITNLLNNAVKYSPEDKNINVTLKEKDGWVTVSIADKGIGIKPGEHEKIFQRFYRSEFNNNISFSGFGIGLYISAEIIKRHNGKIGVISEEGKGADFYFQLPVVS